MVKNNENGGRPSYTATCGEDCITDYDKIPGKEYIWLKNTQNKVKDQIAQKWEFLDIHRMKIINGEH